ncbi:hypothetical protein NDU88_002429 [Pleurodeles waltl]|uniref:Gypsy retrotransposon integrase-like protein 1 n=1 Tax=Pleurodeles waltl TaxID=8319 RepID=A0AAV7UB81_PLEWA|nr:hypothetical protein NDU88_002429 [Pleurodeles waltl]
MPLILRTLLRNKRWAVTLLDSAAEVTICRQSLKDHLDATATSDYIAVKTADGRVLPPDRVYDLTIQIEGDVKRTISVIFWDELTSDILLAERDWPPEHVRKLPNGEDVILPSFSDLVPEAAKGAYAAEWALAQAPALYYAERIKPLYDLVQPNFSSRRWTIEHTHILRDMQQDKLEAKHLHTCDNKTNLVIRIIAGALGFTYVTFNEDETIPIAYKSHLYSNAEQLFALTEKILTAVQMAVIKERPLSQGKRIIVVSPVPALEAVTKASVPNAKALHPCWIQWATSLTATDVDYIFDPRLQTQEFLQYEQEYPAPLNILPLDSYDAIIYTDGSAQPAVGNTLADEEAKASVATASVAAVTRSRMRLDNEILITVKASAAGKALPKGYPTNYTYHISAQNVAYTTIPGVGDQMIPNEDQRLELITAAHEGVASAHAGIQATITIVQQHYWWPGLCRRTKQYVICCDICQHIKGSNIKRPQQTSLLVSDKPLQCVYLDHCGPLQPDGAYKYILVAVDSCSRFLWVWPQRSADARTVIKDLLILIGTYAVAAFHSDQGPAFASKAFRDTMGTMGVELHYSSPYHPEGNSVVERRNRDLKQFLTARVLGSGRSWLHHLNGVQRALNNLPRRSLGRRSPYEVLFGIPVYVPDLDTPGMVAAETPFDIKERLTVLQELQQFCDDKSSTSAGTLGIRELAKTSTG